MSGSAAPGQPGNPGASQPAPPSGDPSMEDILASIRRILSEDESGPGDAASPHPGSGPTAVAVPSREELAPDDVLILNSSMLVPEEEEMTAGEPHLPTTPATPTSPAPASGHAAAAAPSDLAAASDLVAPEAAAASDLVAPEAAAAAASSVGNLVRTLSTERSALVTARGPTIEDIVRQEIRPLLKAWLDVNLAPMVERLVRVEIERVVGRVNP